MQSKRLIFKKHVTNYTDNESDKFYELIPRVRQFWNHSSRICERPNYIPHQTPRNCDRSEWHYAYLPQLIHIYNIIIDIIKENYPRNKIKWYSNENIFHNLSRMIYYCSSKYIQFESKKLHPCIKDGKNSSSREERIKTD
jgi:hypothetical protein